MPSRRLRPPAAGATIRGLLTTAVAVALAVAVPMSAGRTAAGAADAAGPADAATVPPLQSLMISQPLPGYTVAPTGPTDGPLTPTEFGSQSTSPQRAEEQFDALAAEPDFGAFIRLWTDGTGPGEGANDVAVLLFRIPRLGDAESFAAGLAAPFAGSDPFDVPSIPGAHGYSVHIATPVRAVEQIVVFRAGEYVSMAELASSSSVSNTATLTPSQAVAVSFQQYGSVRHGDPGRSADPRPRATPNVPAGPPSNSVTLATVLEVAALVALAAGAMWAFAFRPLRRHRPGWPVADPWEPGGIFDLLGATIPARTSTWDHARRFPDLSLGPWAEARPVPALVSAASAEPAATDRHRSLASPWTGSGANGLDPSVEPG